MYRLAILLLALGCAHPGDSIEALCIKGRISADQALVLNHGQWERRPGYCAGETYTDKDGVQREGQAHCDAERYDRILAAHCPLAGKILDHGD